MPTDTRTKPIKIRNGRGYVMVAVTEPHADLLERAAGQKGLPVTTWVHRVALREAREQVGYLASEVGK